MELNDALWWETIDTEVLLRRGVATLVGLLLGLDRELKGYDAGLRTHGMVALSSSLMTVVAIALYHQLGGADSSLDPRSEERRVGKECVRTCRSRWSP